MAAAAGAVSVHVGITSEHTLRLAGSSWRQARGQAGRQRGLGTLGRGTHRELAGAQGVQRHAGAPHIDGCAVVRCAAHEHLKKKQRSKHQHLLQVAQCSGSSSRWRGIRTGQRQCRDARTPVGSEQGEIDGPRRQAGIQAHLGRHVFRCAAGGVGGALRLVLGQPEVAQLQLRGPPVGRVVQQQVVQLQGGKPFRASAAAVLHVGYNLAVCSIGQHGASSGGSRQSQREQMSTLMSRLAMPRRWQKSMATISCWNRRRARSSGSGPPCSNTRAMLLMPSHTSTFTGTWSLDAN